MSEISISNTNPKILLVASRALAALRPSLIAFLIVKASELSGGGETPISFCNVLFVGNLCAALLVMGWFGVKPIISDLKEIDWRLWLGLIVNACLAALLSSLIFIGLGYTTVTNAVLLGRFGPVLYAIAGAFLFDRRLHKAEWFGFSLIMVGILAIVLKSNDFQINRGDLFILGSALVYAVTSVLGKVMLFKDCTLRTMVFTRNFLSSIIFFIIAMRLFGAQHFADVFSGQLWIVMVVYALVVIVMAQFLWYGALEKLDAKTVGRWTVLSPVFGIVYAYLLNGERPTVIQGIAFAVIMAGVLISTFGKQPLMPKELAGGVESSASAS